MREITAKQLVLTLTGMTIGVGLMLPEIDLLTALGLAIVFATGPLASTEEQTAKRLGSVFIGLGLCMLLVVLSVWGGDVLAPRKGGPDTWYLVGLIVTWFVCSLWEYWKWRETRPADASKH
jgi:hypothetical protein